MARDGSVQRPRILIMDDEESVRFVSGLKLRSAGCEVCFAEDGAAAVGLYRSALEAGEGFDAVILDVNVPGEMGGLETMRALQALDPKVKAFVSSGCPEDPAVLDHRAYGFVGVIEKPHFYLKKSLLRELESLLGSGA